MWPRTLAAVDSRVNLCHIWYMVDTMQKTTLYLPSELQRGLRDLSQRTGRAQASIIREALAEYVSRQDQPWPRSIGSADDGLVRGRDSEAWLADEWSRQGARLLRRSSPG